MTSRRLIIDGQILQTPAWHRGMGKYSLAFMSSLDKAEWSDIEILLSNKIPIDDDVLKDLKRRVEGVKITLLDLLPNAANYQKVENLNRKTVDEYLSKLEGDGPTHYLILSLFQQEIFPVYPSSPKIHKILLIYDLIPLMFHNLYLDSPITKRSYLPKIKELLLADRYLTISKTVANDLAAYIGVDSIRISNIDGGPIEHSTASPPKVSTKERPFILMPTGDDLRKNNRRGVQAFEAFNRQQGYKFSLVITSFFKAGEIEELKSFSGNLVFTGNVSGEELDMLFATAHGVLFPSEYEGLGLPVLEAVNKNKPVACSDISAFREMSPNAFHLFDPYSVESIEKALIKMIQTPIVNKTKYKDISDNYTWDKTAEKFNMAIEKSLASPTQRPKKIAMFSLDPSTDNSIARTLLLAHAELSRNAEADYYYTVNEHNSLQRANFLPFSAVATKIEPGFEFNPAKYNETYYCIGNGEEFSGALFAALANPGVLVLYDVRIKEAWLGLVSKGFVDNSRLDLEKQLDVELGNDKTELITSLIAKQKVVIVFSESAKQAVESILGKVGSNTVVRKLNIPTSPIVFRDILPDKDHTVTIAEDEELIPDDISLDIVTDFQLFSHLARLKALVFKTESQISLAPNSMLYGALCCVPEVDYFSDLPNDVVLKYKNFNEAKDLIEDQLADKISLEKVIGDGVSYAKKSCYMDFAADLINLAGADDG